MKTRIVLAAVAVLAVSITAVTLHGKPPKKAPVVVTAWDSPPPVDPSTRPKGRVRTFLKRRPPALEPQAPDLSFKGTVVKPDPQVTGRALADQQEIAAVLMAQNFEPPQRLAHFQWLKQHNMSVVNWHAAIRSVVPDGDSVLVKVVVRPNLRTERGGLMLTPDETIETYRYANGATVLVDFKDGDHNNRVLFR